MKAISKGGTPVCGMGTSAKRGLVLTIEADDDDDDEEVVDGEDDDGGKSAGEEAIFEEAATDGSSSIGSSTNQPMSEVPVKQTEITCMVSNRACIWIQNHRKNEISKSETLKMNCTEPVP